MALPPLALCPSFNIERLSHVECRVTDPAASRPFYVGTLGLPVTQEDTGTIYLRAMEERGHHHSILPESDAAIVA